MKERARRKRRRLREDDTTEWRTVKDLEEMIQAIESSHVSADQSSKFIPLVAADLDASFVHEEVTSRLGPHFANSLRRDVTYLFEYGLDRIVEEDAEFPRYRHFIIDGRVDERFARGLEHLYRFYNPGKLPEQTKDDA